MSERMRSATRCPDSIAPDTHWNASTEHASPAKYSRSPLRPAPPPTAAADKDMHMCEGRGSAAGQPASRYRLASPPLGRLHAKGRGCCCRRLPPPRRR
jgi:hypothetical protein